MTDALLGGLKRLRMAAGAFVSLMGVLVLLGWIFGVAAIKSVLPHLATMKANTAVCFLLAGLALWLWPEKDGTGWRGRMVTGCAGLIATIGLLTLGEYMMGLSFGIDELLFRDSPLSPLSPYPGRMGSNTAINHVLIGAALLLARSSGWRARLSQVLALLAGLIAFIALVGYVYSLNRFISFVSYTRIGLHTALCFLVLALGILCLRPEVGVMRLAISGGLAGTVLRRLLPLTAVALLVLDWLIERGERAGFYGQEWNTPLFSVAGVVAMSLLVWWNARSLALLEAARAQAEHKQRKLDVQMRITLESIGDAVIATDNAGCITFMNAVAEHLTGWPQLEAQGRPLAEVFRIINEESRQPVEGPIAIVLREGVVAGLANHTLLIARDGSEYAIDDSGAPIRDETGRIIGVVIVFRDVSEQRRAAVERERMLQRLSEQAELLDRAHVLVFNPAGVINFWNRGAEDLYGWTREEAVNHTAHDLLQTRFPKPFDEIKEQLLREGVWQGELIRRTRDGRQIFVASHWTLHRDAQGEPVAILEVNNDITERKEAEERFRLVVESAPNALLMVNRNGQITLVNSQAEQLFGYGREELLGAAVEMLVPERFRRQHSEYRAGFFANPEFRKMGAGRDLFCLRRDGSEVPVEIGLNPKKTTEGEFVLISVIDITERKLAEKKLRESQQQYEALVWTSAQIVWETNAEGAVEMDSPTWREFTGQTFDEWKGFGWLDAFHPDDRERVSREWKKSVETKTPIEIEYRVRHRSGEWRWMTARATSLLNADGSVQKWVGMNADITERKQAEEELRTAYDKELLARSEAEAARAEAEAANRSKDEFLAIVSHELRSPLNAILGYNRLLRAKPNDEALLKQTCDIIERNARTQLQLVEDLLDTARIISGKLRLEVRPIDIVTVLDEAIETVQPTAKAKGIELIAHYDLKPEVITGDATRLQQVIWNLLSNAIKFTPEGGRVELRMERDSERISIVVHDTGKGIAPEFLPHIFDRFRQADSSASRRHGGLGLGLALVKHLVEMHGGQIEAASEGLGRGATFIVTLPLAAQTGLFTTEPLALSATAAAEEVRTEGAIPLPDEPRLEGVCVLVVDDQEDARMALTSFLGKCGVTVTAVSSGARALAILSNSPSDEWPDVLVCDIAMPDEDGYTVLRRVRELEADRGVAPSDQLPAIALTALARSEDRIHALRAGFRVHVAKPIEPAELVVVIANIVGQTS